MNNDAGEKTEKASPKKRRDEREKGNVFKSTDLTSAVALLTMFGILKIFGKGIINNSSKVLIQYLSPQGDLSQIFTIKGIQHIAYEAIFNLIVICIPIYVTALISGVAVNYLQVGFLFSTKSLTFKGSRINPLAGMKRIISSRALAELLKSLAKVIILGIIAYQELHKNFEGLSMLMLYDIKQSWSALASFSLQLALKSGIALAILSVGDYVYQWWRYEKDIKMTKQEVKEEFKLTEGNPQTKNRIRQKQREVGMSRMMQKLPHADVVIANPTHYAVALQYDEKISSAPIVIAKGKDYVALKIKEKARELNIEIVENKPLARSLYFYCDIGQQIPADLYKAVAEVLAYVYKLKRKQVRR
ncbi:MAG: flagellar biosynthesis protein FlhB [Bacillota bacterium]|nr:flagellar biosynthesis protein FlhB [Bacillota bacterium]